jgi:hypothetical protein
MLPIPFNGYCHPCVTVGLRCVGLEDQGDVDIDLTGSVRAFALECVGPIAVVGALGACGDFNREGEGVDIGSLRGPDAG